MRCSFALAFLVASLIGLSAAEPWFGFSKIHEKLHPHHAPKQNTEPEYEIDMLDLVGTFGAKPDYGITNNYKMPRTEKEAQEQGWVIPTELSEEKYTKTYCMKNDGRICVMYDLKGSCCGIIIAVLAEVDELKMEGIDLLDKGFTKEVLFGDSLYVNRIYFVEQEVIQNGGRDNSTQVGTGLFLNIKKKLVQIPLFNEKKKLEEKGFVLQNCFPGMGVHYFYGLSAELTPQEFAPWFVLYGKDGKLVGFGFELFGSKVDKWGEERKARAWMENVTADVIKAIAPDVPPFVLDYIKVNGPWSFHCNFVSNPPAITCPATSTPKPGATY